MNNCGSSYPEPADLGPRERPTLLGTAAVMLSDRDVTPAMLAGQAALPVDLVETILAAGSDTTPRLCLS